MKDGSHFSSSRINTIFTDKEGIVWLGTYDHGLLRGIRPTPWYLTGWAYTLYILAGVGLIFLLLFGYRKLKRPTSLQPEQPTSPSEKEAEQVPTEYEELIRRATLLVEQHYATSGYSVERLAQDLCMDRTGLYKKMTAAIDKTPTAFIRNIRLNHAAQLIREGKLTMNEVAEQTGFSSASYMARCFQEEWGKKPSELREF
ncbi:MAG: helix-turn-helix domain-containing protein [Bacteroidaceae bacterium]|nr:helix-turn-helix domain-containing protein [Bacteroidaceae bacterium]